MNLGVATYIKEYATEEALCSSLQDTLLHCIAHTSCTLLTASGAEQALERLRVLWEIAIGEAVFSNSVDK